MKKETLTPSGRRLINILRKRLARNPKLMLISNSFNFAMPTEKKVLDVGFRGDIKCGCAISVSTIGTPYDFKYSFYDNASIRLQKQLGVSHSYLNGIVSGFDNIAVEDINDYYLGDKNYVAGHNDGKIIRKRLSSRII